MKKLYLFISTLLVATAAIATAAPANDNFANSQAISTGLTTTNLSTATVEAGEPKTSIGKTVWYTYTAPSDLIVTIDSTGTNFSTHFANVYMGNSINNLIFIDGDDSGGSTTPFSFSFKAKAGSTYKISAGNYIDQFNPNGSNTEIKLTLFTTAFNHVGDLYSNLTPTDSYITNDLFNNRTNLSGASLTVNSYMNSASAEAGEPDTSTGKTAWYSYTATSDSVISINTTGTEFPFHFVSVYMGTVINNLNKVSGGSTSSNNPFTTTFKTKAGTTYQICAGAVISQLNGSGGLMQFTLTTSPYTYSGTLYGPEVPTAPTPVNDSFYTPQVLTGNLLTVIGSTANATTEPGEQAFTKTLWHSWQAPSNKLVSIDFPPNTSGGFGIYTGDTLQSAVQVEPRSDSTNTSLKFDAQAGVTYKLVIGSITGQHQFVLTATDPPPVAPVTPVAPVAPVTPNPPANPGTPVTPDDGYTEPPVVNYGPASKITFPKNGQVVTTKGFKFKGNFESYDGYDIVAFEFSIDNKKFIRSTYPTKKSLFSGKLKKGKRILKMRSLDSSGVWGPYDTITVRVK